MTTSNSLFLTPFFAALLATVPASALAQEFPSSLETSREVDGDFGEAHAPSFGEMEFAPTDYVIERDTPELETSELETPELEAPGLGFTEIEIQSVQNLTNRARSKRGLSPLKLDSRLSRVAQKFAQDMRDRGYFSHQSPEGVTMQMRLKRGGVEYGYAGENIARGHSDGQEVVSGWMNSRGHRANILHPKFEKIGVGRAGKVWVQLFTD